jgi:CubicO group peptidase (beta-lactamase class C family)
MTAVAARSGRSLAAPAAPSGQRAPGDYAALGQLIADVTGSDYATAVTRLLLGPLGMTGSSFPANWPHLEAGTCGQRPNYRGAISS